MYEISAYFNSYRSAVVLELYVIVLVCPNAPAPCRHRHPLPLPVGIPIIELYCNYKMSPAL